VWHWRPRPGRLSTYSNDIMAIQLSSTYGILTIFNIYNDCTNPCIENKLSDIIKCDIILAMHSPCTDHFSIATNLTFTQLRASAISRAYKIQSLHLLMFQPSHSHKLEVFLLGQHWIRSLKVGSIQPARKWYLSCPAAQ
jgi:hypothetical protein